MRCPGFGLLLLGMAVVANAAEPENVVFSRSPELPMLRVVQFESAVREHATPYRLSLSVVPTPPQEISPFGAEFDSTSRLPAAIERQKEIAWVANTNRTGIFGRERTSLLPLLRFESKVERLEVRPRRHSLSVEWRLAFH